MLLLEHVCFQAVRIEERSLSETYSDRVIRIGLFSCRIFLCFSHQGEEVMVWLGTRKY